MKYIQNAFLVLMFLIMVGLGLNMLIAPTLGEALQSIYQNNYIAWAISGLTTNQVPYADSSTTLAGDSGLTYNASTTTLAATHATVGGANVTREASYTIAPSNAPAYIKAQADFVVSGNADDEIQAAISALPSGGGSIYLLEGTFTIGSTVQIDRNRVKIYGTQATIVKAATNLNANIFESTKSANRYQCVFEGFLLDGNKTNNASGNIFDLTNFRQVRLQNLTIFQAKDVGVYANGSSNTTKTIWIENCIITDCGSHGVDIRAVYIAWVTHNYIGSNGGNGINTSVGGEWEISHNSIDENTGRGIYVYGTDSLSIHDNQYIGDNGYAGVETASGCDDLTITNNQILENGVTTHPAGIYFGGTLTGLIVEGNRIYDNSSGDQDYAIDLAGSFNPTIIQGNDLTDYHTAAVNGSSSNVTFSNNTGYITENSGTFIGTGAAQQIPHGLSYTPAWQDIGVFSDNVTGTAFQTSAPNSVNITITVTAGSIGHWGTIGN